MKGCVHTQFLNTRNVKIKRWRNILTGQFVSDPIRNIDLSDKVNFSYIIGVMLGDGTSFLSKKRGFIQLCQTKKTFAESFARSLRKINLKANIWKQQHRYVKWGFVWVVKAETRKLSKFFKEQNFDRFNEFVFHSKDCQKEFIRGFFESEGTNCIIRDKSGRWPRTRWTIKFEGKGEKLYDFVERVLDSLGFAFSRRYCEKKDVQILEKSTRIHNYRFIRGINPIIKNKIIDFLGCVRKGRGRIDENLSAD